MVEPWKFLLAPLIGGIIGYITNDLAIKMLFRPRKAVYIGKWRVPFTPGLIPQQKNRIAASVGRVVSAQLLDLETLKESILSESVLQKLKMGICEKAEQYRDDERTVEQVLEHYMTTEKLDCYRENLTEAGTRFLLEKMEQEDLGTKIVRYGMDILKEKLQIGMLGMFMDEGLIRGLESTLGEAVNDIIREEAPEAVRKEVEKIEKDILEMRLCDIYKSQEERIPVLAERISEVYRMLLESNLGKILQAVNIEKIVVEKVSSFDAVQLEQMIFGIMKKELRAIVYLGALLGFMMGFVNLLF